MTPNTQANKLKSQLLAEVKAAKTENSKTHRRRELVAMFTKILIDGECV